MLSDIEIAQSAKMLPITEIAEKLDILPEAVSYTHLASKFQFIVPWHFID